MVALAVLGSLLMTAPVAQAVDVNQIERNEVSLINHYRLSKGLSRLTIDYNLTRVAEWMGGDMTAYNYFDHSDHLGRDPFDRMRAFGYPSDTWRGENLAAGNETAQLTFDQWKESPDHNANMLDPHYTVIGISRVYSETAQYGYYWTTEFGSKFTRGVPNPKMLAKYTSRQKTRIKKRWPSCAKTKRGSRKFKKKNCGYYLRAARQLGYR